MTPPLKISHEQILDAVRRSGYLLEYRVAQVLGRYGYVVQANQAYPDPFTGKSRELDISAITAKPVTGDYKNIIFPLLLIECVNNPQPMAFFTKQPVAPTAHIYDLNFSGIPVQIRKGKYWTKLSEFLDMQDYHHHCKGRIATQFCSFTPKKNTKPVEWLAQHEDRHFDSFNKLCFALNHDIDDHYSRTKLLKREAINVQIYYQILVVSGEIIEIAPRRKDLKLRSTNHIHFVQSYVTRGKEQRYHIDVVTETYLPRLLKKIDTELNKTVTEIRRRKNDIQRSIDRIAASAKGLRSDGAIRARLEYSHP